MTTPTHDESCTLVIFGASGDLTRRKLIPALWSMFQSRVLPEPFAVVGVARSEMTNEQFRARMREAISDFARVQPPSARVWDRFAQALFYYSGDPADSAMYPGLATYLKQVEQERGASGNRLFYVSTPPSVYPHLVTRLGEAGLTRPAENTNGWVRIIIEKPFGRDLASAGSLNQVVASAFTEDQIYRIDHYLGKETVQNILVFRWANGIFEPLWNRNHVDHVQITVGESIGVEGRGAYYEESGALRDMIQNHILQLLCLVAMEPPVTFDADPVRDEKTKVMRAIRPIAADEVDRVAVRGQYGPGFVSGQRVVGYREEKGVSAESITESFAALRLEIENWRWAGVPFYLRTGKRLPKRASEIAVQFKRTPHLVFRRNPEILAEPNLLVLRIQPDEGMSLSFGAKLPGAELRIKPVEMEFDYGKAFGGEPPEAYERLLLDAMKGDATLYARGDWVTMAWELLQPVLDAWAGGDPRKFPNYEAGTWGPAEADTLIERSGRRWRRP
ncbi:MAG TPA: glucose-6-phosphate dehydrogenase [Candidatus Acidoferrum sp.]|jgi:glucose-6-phosphate 1-dehydrogenase|nr:glucose-6-phosphate dehydrogenase [Candidatus Acidoferrum sp.]